MNLGSRASVLALALALAGAGSLRAAETAAPSPGREAVLKQVDLPHSYYWRELYLPQLTTGPSSASFLPDSRSLVYSMEGSLWRQEIGSDTAQELTHPQGAYDYQPDVAGDGRSLVFTRYDGKSLQLWRLDLVSGREQALTQGDAVNVEPRISPDGRQLAWISTQGTGHFKLFVAALDADGLHEAKPLLPERKSAIDRYYYSAFDHEINPSWSPDGKSLVYVSNPETPWGSGGIWILPLADPGQRHKLLDEETSWSARPELAPDGQRLLFASYHGRQTHQLWLSTASGAAPLPLSFGEAERRNARWSPDGRRIAYIGNAGADGNTSLHVLDVVGGADQLIAPGKRRTLAPVARLTVDVLDGKGRRVPARVSVRGSDGRAHAPANAWMHADDGFDRSKQAIETQYFHCASPCALELPAGPAEIRVQHGFAHDIWNERIDLVAGRSLPLRIKLKANGLPAEYGEFLSADLHVHMNYGGHYRNTPSHLSRQALAEGLDVVENLIVNKEERIPDIAWSATETVTWFGEPGVGTDADKVLIAHDQEFHSSFWGHMGLLHLTDHYISADFASYRHTAMASPYPYNGVIADLAHAQGGVVGYVHPFDTIPDPVNDASLTNELPADVAMGKVDYIEVVGFSDHKSTAEVWYRLMNLGYHLPAGAGTDAMANYASLRGPVGMNRVFLDTKGRSDTGAFLDALKRGRGFVSNGPLLGFRLGGGEPGGKVSMATPGKQSFRVSLRSPVPIEHLELVQNGKVIRSFDLGGDRRHFDSAGELDIAAGGWVLLRAWNEGADPQLMDLYPYATTNPVWLELPAKAPAHPEAAAYFVAWLDRVVSAVQARDDFNTAAEKSETLGYLGEARAIYQSKAEGK